MTEAEARDKGRTPPAGASPAATGSSTVSPHAILAVLILFVAIAVAATHWRALSAKALSLDDGQYLLQNRLVQNPSWDSIATFFGEVLEPSTVQGYYQPLAMTSLMLDTSLGGRPDNVGPFHRTSLALHIANTTLVVVLLYLLFGNAWIAAGVGLLFGLHPMTVEPITWIGERKTVLATFFALSCFIVYAFHARRPNGMLYTVALVLFLLALLSKPTTTPLPALLLLLDFWPLRRRWGVGQLVEKLPFFGLAALFAAITFVSQRNTATVKLPQGAEILERVLLRPAHNLVFYLGKMAWPRQLSPHYPDPVPFSVEHPAVLAGVIGTALLVVLALVSLRWTRAALTGGLFFFIAILPTLGVVGYTNVVAADKFVYLPALGILLILAAVGTALWKRFGNTNNPAIRCGCVLAMVVALGSMEVVATARQVGRWQSTERLYRYMVALAPQAAVVHRRLGLEMREQGRTEEALVFLRKALQLDPDDHYAHNTLGTVCADQGVALEQEAKQCMEEGRALFKENKAAEGQAKVAEYRELDVRMKDAFDEAIASFRAATQIKLAYVLVRQARKARAEQRNELAQAKYDEAARCYSNAIELNPRFMNARIGLGLVRQDQGRYREAVRAFEDAQLIEPNHPKVRAGLRQAQEALHKSAQQP